MPALLLEPAPVATERLPARQAPQKPRTDSTPRPLADPEPSLPVCFIPVFFLFLVLLALLYLCFVACSRLCMAPQRSAGQQAGLSDRKSRFPASPEGLAD